MSSVRVGWFHVCQYESYSPQDPDGKARVQARTTSSGRCNMPEDDFTGAFLGDLDAGLMFTEIPFLINLFNS